MKSFAGVSLHVPQKTPHMFVYHRGEHTCSRLEKLNLSCYFSLPACSDLQPPRCRRDARVVRAALARLSSGFPPEIQSVAFGSYRAGPLDTLTHGDLRRTRIRFSKQQRNIAHSRCRVCLSQRHRIKGSRCLPSTASSMFSSSLSMLQEAADDHTAAPAAFPVTHGASWEWHDLISDAPLRPHFKLDLDVFTVSTNIRSH